MYWTQITQETLDCHLEIHMFDGYREGSVFSKPVGNPKQINAHGQRVLESILNHPEKQFFLAEFDR